jgi:hypothetical protein
MGQLYCHTKTAVGHHAALRFTRINASLQSYRLQTIKRVAQTLIEFTKKNVPSIRSETVTEGRLSKSRGVGFMSLQEILFGRKIGRLKKTKTGGPTCKARFRSTRRCRSDAGLT